MGRLAGQATPVASPQVSDEDSGRASPDPVRFARFENPTAKAAMIRATMNIRVMGNGGPCRPGPRPPYSRQHQLACLYGSLMPISANANRPAPQPLPLRDAFASFPEPC